MPTLRELQHRLRVGLLADDEAITGDVAGDGLTPAARIAVYRHHVLTSLTAALEATFPVVMRLVDPRFFRYACDRYVRTAPPAGPCLFEYGATFPDFLADFRPCRHLPWLPDVARLEWAMNVALHAPDAVPLGLTSARAMGAAALAGRPLGLHPSVTLLVSPWPVDAIWRAHRPDADPDGPLDLDGGQTRLAVWRRDDAVVFRPLSPAALAFRRAIGRGAPLAEAAAAVEVAALLREALEDEVLIDCAR
jgi:hypothetical protein